MVKIQKPVPKKLGQTNNPENPFKKKAISKKKPSFVKSIKAELLESPIEEKKARNKTNVGKEKKTKVVAATDGAKQESSAPLPPKIHLAKNKSVKPQSAPPVLPDASKVAQRKAKLQKKKERKLAAQNTKDPLKSQVAGDEIKPAKSKYDAVPFNEEKFKAILNSENIKKIAKALMTELETKAASKRSSIFEDYRYLLQVGCFKIPNAPKRMVKLSLKHSLVDKEDDVLLVVPDLQRGAKVDYEPTLHHYEDLLRSQGVEGVTVMPMNQLRKEYTTFEQRRRLFATYDYFMCDGRIVAHVGGMIGKFCQRPRHTFHAVRLNDERRIKLEIEKSLRRTAYRQVAKGTLTTIAVGSHKLEVDQLVDNIQFVIEQLKKLYAGGWANIRHIYLNTDITGTPSLPLFISMAQGPDQTPEIIGPREQRMIKLKKEANEVLSKFNLTKDGAMIKLSKTEAEKKRKSLEMKATLKADEQAAKKAKKEEKKAVAGKGEKVVEEIEFPENEEDDDDDGNESDDDDDEDDDEHVTSSDEGEEEINQEEDDDEEGAETGSETEIVENGIDDEESEDSDNEQEADSESSEEGDDDDEDDDSDDDEEVEEDESD